jgi:ABC-2 type transport system permease protein
MARVLVQLKLRLVLNALRSSAAARTSFILSAFFALVVAAGVFYVLARFRGLSASADLTTVIFSMFAPGWLILPIFAFGLDGTLDPARLQLYPLRTRPLAVGLLAASAAGAWPAANLLGLLGVWPVWPAARWACWPRWSLCPFSCCSASRWPGW